MKDLTAILEQGRVLHEQMVAAGQVRHAFVPHRIDDRCDACGLSPENDLHIRARQERLL